MTAVHAITCRCRLAAWVSAFWFQLRHCSNATRWRYIRGSLRNEAKQSDTTQFTRCVPPYESIFQPVPLALACPHRMQDVPLARRLSAQDYGPDIIHITNTRSRGHEFSAVFLFHGSGSVSIRKLLPYHVPEMPSMSPSHAPCCLGPANSKTSCAKISLGIINWLYM